jgi:hypothetical protein
MIGGIVKIFQKVKLKQLGKNIIYKKIMCEYFLEGLGYLND